MKNIKEELLDEIELVKSNIENGNTADALKHLAIVEERVKNLPGTGSNGRPVE